MLRAVLVLPGSPSQAAEIKVLSGNGARTAVRELDAQGKLIDDLLAGFKPWIERMKPGK